MVKARRSRQNVGSAPMARVRKGPRRRKRGGKVVVTPAPQLDEFVKAAAHALGLPVRPQWLAAIKANLETNLRFATMVGEFPLPDESEPAPVFSP
jgi:hypothetical protein